MLNNHHQLLGALVFAILLFVLMVTTLLAVSDLESLTTDYLTEMPLSELSASTKNGCIHRCVKDTNTLVSRGVKLRFLPNMTNEIRTSASLMAHRPIKTVVVFHARTLDTETNVCSSRRIPKRSRRITTKGNEYSLFVPRQKCLRIWSLPGSIVPLVSYTPVTQNLRTIPTREILFAPMAQKLTWCR